MSAQKTPMRKTRPMSKKDYRTSTTKKRLWLWRTIFALVLGALALGFIGYFWHQAQERVNKTIASNIEQLCTIFTDINKTCGIESFEHEVNYIDFLTVKSFQSKQVGAMRIKSTDGWHGPYVTENPNIQTKKYEIIHTNKGYFITPGCNVALSDGRIIGKDILLNYETDIQELIDNGILRTKDGKALACAVTLSN